ncbi:hypothetical protein [Endozoicomonas sp. 4G]|uniref:hypothetical protein n=1 Tax=Endozoicomonas sp. 4G TaxID=2872754 RepID=UPI002078DC61|nr:hypothetical protein [Endozoicomonas sp. 4G]
MPSKKPLILTLVIAFSVHCFNGQAQENRLPLRFALAVGKVLFNAPKPFIEVLSIKGIYYVAGVETIFLPLFPLRDGLPDEQETEAIEWWELNGVEAKVHSRATSDDSAYSEDSDSEDSSTSDESNDDRLNEDEDEANTESEVWYETTTINPFRVSNEISHYGATLEPKKIKEEPVLDSEIAINGSIDNRSNEDESEVRYETTTINPFRVSNEISQYGATLEPKKIKQEPVSDSEVLTSSSDDQRIKRPKIHQCDHEGCNYSTNVMNNLNRHKQIHLPVDQIPKVHQCDHEGCNYRTRFPAHLKAHKQTHLPAHQRPKRHRCDHQGCNHSTDKASDLKRHKQTHLPADQRPKRLKVHLCDQEGCNYSTAQTSHLKRHKQTHLPADHRPKRPKIHQCDHEDCNYSAEQASDLKRHKQTHSPADQRPNRSKNLQCDHEDCNYSTDRTSNMKRHKQTHLPAEQRPKRKSYDPLPPNKKRKKGDKE